MWDNNGKLGKCHINFKFTEVDNIVVIMQENVPIHMKHLEILRDKGP